MSKKKSIKQQTQEFLEADVPVSNIKFFHRFFNQNYDTSLYYSRKSYTDSSSVLDVYSSTKSLEYSLVFANTESSVLHGWHFDNKSKTPPNQNTHPYPLAVRYANHQKGVYVIERPPFQADIDFSFKKNMFRKQIPALEGKKIWIPWTVSVVSMGKSISEYAQYLYFSEGPLSSFDQKVYSPVLPNLFGDSRICFGDSSFHLQQRINKKEIDYSIADVFTYLFNDYFSNWNPDLAYNYDACHAALTKMDVFNKIRALKPKKLPKNFDEIYSWKNSYGKFWFYFLYCMSFLSYEETLEFYRLYSEIANKNIRSEKSYYTQVSELIKQQLKGFELTEDLYQDANFEYTIKEVINYGDWSRFFSFRHLISNAAITVKVKDIPENKYINQDFVSSPNLVGYIYFNFFKKLSEDHARFLAQSKNSYNALMNTNIDNLMSYDNVLSSQESFDGFNISEMKALSDSNFVAFLNIDKNSVNNRPISINVKYEDVLSGKMLLSEELEKIQ